MGTSPAPANGGTVEGVLTGEKGAPAQPPECVRGKVSVGAPRGRQAVQWLGLGGLTVVSRVRSLVGELRSCKLGCGQKKKKNKGPTELKNSGRHRHGGGGSSATTGGKGHPGD